MNRMTDTSEDITLPQTSFASGNKDLLVNLFYCRYVALVPNRTFVVIGLRPDGWFQVVFNFIGPNEDQGFNVYNDGVQVDGRRINGSAEYPPGDGRIVLGRFYTNSNSSYASAYFDELYFFNQCLTDEQIRRLNQS